MEAGCCEVYWRHLEVLGKVSEAYSYLTFCAGHASQNIGLAMAHMWKICYAEALKSQGIAIGLGKTANSPHRETPGMGCFCMAVELIFWRAASRPATLVACLPL